MAVLPTRAKGIILILAGGILFLFFLFWNDVSSVRNRFHLPDSPYDGSRPPRPQYPPFNPPPLGDPPPAHEHDEGLPRPKPVQPAQDVWKTRAEAVKQSFLHAYNGYEKYAFPADELRPLSNGKVDNFNGWGVSAVDALDTMLLMGLNKEFDRAIQHVATINFTMPMYEYAPFFETIIRYLGGFLSAYALSGEPILLSRADELGMKLLPAFNTTSGLPVWGINTENGRLNDHGTVLLAEMGSCQMEYKYLAHLTGRTEFFKAADRVMDIMINTQHPVHAMWPTTFTIQGGTPVNDVYTIGALADSAYEYLLKQYIMSNKTEIRLAELYMKSITGVLTNLVYISPTRNLVYVTDSYYGMRPSRKFEHLSCFFPGLLALGVAELPPEIMSPELKEIHMWAAEAIGHSCWVMYADRKSGLGPETVTFEAPTSATFNPMPGQTYEEQQKVQQRMLEKERWMTKVGEWVAGGRKGHGGAPPGVRDADGPLYGKEGKKDYFESDDNYLLRPETLESMFVLWRTTGDSKWRDRGWEIWSSIEANTKTESGYASQNAVTRETMIPQESLPSYFFAETIKYAYLLTLDPSSDPLPESKFVLNTEAHPLPIFNWRDWEKERWNIGKTLHESLGLDKTIPVETATGAGADTGAGVKGGLKQHDWEFKGPETNEEKVKDYVYEDLEGAVYKGGAAAAAAS